MPPVPDPDERWWPGGGSEPPRVAGPHVHVWRAHTHPSGWYNVEVCIRPECQQPNWDQLDELLRERMRRACEVIGERLVDQLKKMY